jgi:hypothetical protein
VGLLGGPAVDISTAMQEDFEKADDAGIVDLDARMAHRADCDRQREALQSSTWMRARFRADYPFHPEAFFSPERALPDKRPEAMAPVCGA